MYLTFYRCSYPKKPHKKSGGGLVAVNNALGINKRRRQVYNKYKGHYNQRNSPPRLKKFNDEIESPSI